MRQHEITCPSCHKLLSMEWQVTDTALTCPSCLAPIANPRVAVQATPLAPHSEPTTATCPGCGETVQPGWTYCPHCNERLYSPPPRPVARGKAELDVDVQRDARASKICLIIFLLLVTPCIIFLFLYAVTPVERTTLFGSRLPAQAPAQSSGGPGVLAVTLIVAGLLVAGTIVLIRHASSTAARAIAVSLGTFSVVVVLLMGLCALALASCTICGPPP